MDAITAALGLMQSASNNDSQTQQNYQLELMNKQHEYNTEGVNHQAELQKQMFQDTGYEARVKQLKNAGLNPALLYSGGAGSGGVTGSISAPQVSEGSAPNVAAATQAKTGQVGMMLQMQKTQSEIEVNKAQAQALTADAENKTQNTSGQKFDLGIKTETREQTLNQIKNLSEESGENLISKQLANTLSTLTLDKKVEMTAAELSNKLLEGRNTVAETFLKEGQLQEVLTSSILKAQQANFIEKDYNLRVKELAQQLKIALGSQGLTQEQIDQNRTRMWVDATAKAIGIAIGAGVLKR